MHWGKHRLTRVAVNSSTCPCTRGSRRSTVVVHDIIFSDTRLVADLTIRGCLFTQHSHLGCLLLTGQKKKKKKKSPKKVTNKITPITHWLKQADTLITARLPVYYHLLPFVNLYFPMEEHFKTGGKTTKCHKQNKNYTQINKRRKIFTS